MQHEHIGRAIRRLRRSRDLTQAQLAHRAGIHRQHLSAIERGLRPGAALVDRLAAALGVSLDALLRNLGAEPCTDETAATRGAGVPELSI